MLTFDILLGSGRVTVRQNRTQMKEASLNVSDHTTKDCSLNELISLLDSANRMLEEGGSTDYYLYIRRCVLTEIHTRIDLMLDNAGLL